MADSKPERTIYEALPHPDGGWQVKLHGAERASSLHTTKEEAVAEGQRLCRDREPSQLIIKGADGRIQKEYTYGGDPRNVPG